MEHVLENELIRVSASTLGAELSHLTGHDGTEYLWQGNPEFWAGRAYNIFPFVGRLFGGKYTLGGKTYELGIHGFARKSEMEASHPSADRLVFTLRDDDATRAQYPFSFAFHVEYTLRGATLEIAYRVENAGEGEMAFGIGGHPGFNVPLAPGLRFEDYRLVFDDARTPSLELFSDDCFVTGEKRPYPLENGRELPLRHDLFDDDALVFSDVSRAVTLKTEKDSRFVRVEYPDMPYLGVWHRPKSEAPYVCIEPWANLPGWTGVTTDFSRPDLIRLAPGREYRNVWSITLGS